jgi:RNA polymerase sigma-B factor
MSEIGRDERFDHARFLEYAATRDPTLREELITAHLGLARHLARRFANRGEPLEDLVQVASIGVMKSVDRFDPGRGVKFSTFAARTILGELKRHFRDRGWAIRAPRRVEELYLELGQASAVLTQRLGRTPTVEDLAEATGVTVEAVIEATEAASGYRTSPLEGPTRDDGSGDSVAIGSNEPGFGDVDDRVLLSPAISQLDEREQTILRLRFGLGLTQTEIARRIGVSQMHVSRLLSASLRKLRAHIVAGGPSGSSPGESSGRPRP